MNLMGPFRFDMLTHPWFLLLLIPVALLLIAELVTKPYGALQVSTGDTMARLRRRGRTLPRILPPLLRALALTCLIVALARPLNGLRPRIERADVIDILLCVDVSGSMTAEDFEVEGIGRRDRLYVTKQAVRDFVQTRKGRSDDRFGMDRLGLILYAAHAWMQCPLTLDYGVFERELDAVIIDRNDEKTNRTAIGSAVGLAISRLIKSEAKSKVIILLTDGINNHGSLDPITAAQLAKDYDIRVYTIGAGSPTGGRGTRRTLLGTQSIRTSDPIDENTLQRIASITGGKYYRAENVDTLQGAYQEINELETTEVEIGEAYEYEDGFVPYALLGALAISVSVFTRRRWFESIP